MSVILAMVSDLPSYGTKGAGERVSYWNCRFVLILSLMGFAQDCLFGDLLGGRLRGLRALSSAASFLKRNISDACEAGDIGGPALSELKDIARPLLLEPTPLSAVWSTLWLRPQSWMLFESAVRGVTGESIATAMPVGSDTLLIIGRWRGFPGM